MPAVPAVTIPTVLQQGLLSERGLEIASDMISPIDQAVEGETLAIRFEFLTLDEIAPQPPESSSNTWKVSFLIKTSASLAWYIPRPYQDLIRPGELFSEIDRSAFQAVADQLEPLRLSDYDNYHLAICNGAALLAKDRWAYRTAGNAGTPYIAQALIDRVMIAILPHSPSAHGHLLAKRAIEQLPDLVAALAHPYHPIPRFGVAIRN